MNNKEIPAVVSGHIELFNRLKTIPLTNSAPSNYVSKDYAERRLDYTIKYVCEMLGCNCDGVKDIITNLYNRFYENIKGKDYYKANILEWDINKTDLTEIDKNKLSPIIQAWLAKKEISEILTLVNDLNSQSDNSMLVRTFLATFYSEYNAHTKLTYFGFGSGIADGFGGVVGGAASFGNPLIIIIVAACASYDYEYFFE